jgi:hypothetical protein
MMAKKKSTGRDPSDCVHDTYRSQDAGVVRVPMNTKSSTDDIHLNRSTLGTHMRYDPATGSFGQDSNHVKQMARDSMGDLKRSPASREGTRDRERRGFKCATGRHGENDCGSSVKGY